MVRGLQHCRQTTIQEVKDQALALLRRFNVPQDAISEVASMDFPDPYRSVQSGHLQDKYIRTHMDQVVPHRIILGQRLQTKGYGAKKRAVAVDDELFYMPLIASLKQLLSKEGVLETLDFSYNIDDEFICDFSNGTSFKNHALFEKHQESLFLSLYYDDLEVANPIGSHSEHISLFYYSINNLPVRYRTKLCNIRLLAVTERKNIDRYGIGNILKNFVDDVKILEKEGFTLSIDDGDINQLFGTCFNVLGDTLASHLAGGFNQGVGVSFSKCRICHCEFDEMQNNYRSEFFDKWTQEDYDRCINDIENAPTKYLQSHFKTTYGLNEKSPLCQIPSFDITKSLPLDYMHIGPEGFIQYEMKLVFNHYIKAGVFSLNDLNEAIESYEYGHSEIMNKPSPINPTCLADDSNNKLHQQASQATFLLRMSLFILQTLGVDTSSEQFSFMRDLLDIHMRLMAPVISVLSLPSLANLIERHLKHFKKLFPGNNIIPKQHYLVHFPDTILAHGPPCRYSCMRYEANNKSVKSITKAKKNFINVPKTIADEMSKSEAVHLSCDDAHAMFSKDEVGGTWKKVGEADLAYFKRKYLAYCNVNLTDDVFTVNHQTYNSIKYICDASYVTVGVQDGSDLPEFGKIVKIYISNDFILFEVSVLDTKCFDRNVMAYEVCDLDMAMGAILVSPSDLLIPQVLNRSTHDIKDYVSVPFCLESVIKKYKRDRV